MTEREAIHKLRGSLVRCLTLLDDVIDDNPGNCVREQAARSEGLELLWQTEGFQLTLEERNAMDRDKPWLL